MLFPILTESRTLIDLSGIWEFKRDDGNGFSEKWYEGRLTDSITMPVPSSYNDIKEDMSLRDHYGWVFYQKSFSVPYSLLDQRIMLRFDSVTHHAKVYLNGTLICEHKGGFLPFEVQINEFLQSGDNLLTVAVDNRIDDTTLPVGGRPDPNAGSITGQKDVSAGKLRNIPNFDFFNYCGIARPVRIYTTPSQYIKDITVVPSVSGTDGELSCEIETSAVGVIKVECLDEEGNIVAVAEGGNTGKLLIRNVHLWQPLNSYLYTLKIRFENDIYLLPVGIRTVEVKDGQFLINGKPFYFKGYGKHEDTFPAGRGLNMPMNVKDISLMKWQGANSFRTSHYPYSEEMLRLCDREGIVVIDETPAVGVHLNFGGGANFKNGKKINTFDPEEEGGIRTQAHHREVIRDMIMRDKNHACVVMWSIAEEPDSCSEGAYEYFEPLFSLARSLDKQHLPCTLVSVQDARYKNDCSLRLSDVICLNRYYGWYNGSDDFEAAEKAMREEFDFWQNTGKPFMITEYGADTINGMHNTVPVMYTEVRLLDRLAMAVTGPKEPIMAMVPTSMPVRYGSGCVLFHCLFLFHGLYPKEEVQQVAYPHNGKADPSNRHLAHHKEADCHNYSHCPHDSQFRSHRHGPLLHKAAQMLFIKVCAYKPVMEPPRTFGKAEYSRHKERDGREDRQYDPH